MRHVVHGLPHGADERLVAIEQRVEAAHELGEFIVRPRTGHAGVEASGLHNAPGRRGELPHRLQGAAGKDNARPKRHQHHWNSRQHKGAAEWLVKDLAIVGAGSRLQHRSIPQFARREGKITSGIAGNAKVFSFPLIAAHAGRQRHRLHPQLDPVLGNLQHHAHAVPRRPAQEHRPAAGRRRFAFDAVADQRQSAAVVELRQQLQPGAQPPLLPFLQSLSQLPVQKREQGGRPGQKHQGKAQTQPHGQHASDAFHRGNRFRTCGGHSPRHAGC